MEIVPLKAGHIFELRLQDAQALFYEKFSAGYAAALEQAGGYTAMADGRPVACAGFVEQWDGRALAWALVGRDAGPHFVRVTRAVRRALDMAHWRRVEAHVDARFAAGIRWAEMLGFRAESVMEKFTPEGHDAFMYVRIR